MGSYDIAQICLKGHLVTSNAGSHPEHKETYCSKCGQSTIMQCQHCNTSIRGAYNVPGVICVGSSFTIPAYCHSCGEPYPWTNATIREFEEIIDMADEIDDVDRAILKEKFPSLLIESTGSTAAALKLSKILKYAEFTTIQALKSAFASKLADSALELLGWK